MNLIELVNSKDDLDEILDDINELGHDWFVENIEKMDLNKQKRCYAHLMYVYFLDLRVLMYKENININKVSQLADTFHNLPHFLADDLKGFSHDWFWRYYVGEDIEDYLKRNFVSVLRGY